MVWILLEVQLSKICGIGNYHIIWYNKCRDPNGFAEARAVFKKNKVSPFDFANGQTLAILRKYRYRYFTYNKKRGQ